MITHIYYYYIKYSKYLIICIFSGKRKSLKENIQLRLGFEKHLGSKKNEHKLLAFLFESY